nr:MAG TPA: hypothetical protein [Caudoviricetes sp.]
MKSELIFVSLYQFNLIIQRYYYFSVIDSFY